MSFEGTITAADASAGASGPKRWDALQWLLAAVLAAAAVAMQIRLGLDADVSWLLTVGERVLDGDRLYVDIFEVNPPASVLIYLPGLAVARATGLTPELVTAALVFLGAAASIGGAGRVLLRSGLLGRRHAPGALCSSVLAFVLLPAACFAQREHIALLALLPLMAVMAVRSERLPVTSLASLAAGLGSGLAMAIKPHFVLAIGPMVLFAMWKVRSPRVALQLEQWTAAAVVVSYALIVVTLFPQFLSEAMPLLRTVYLPSTSSLRDVWLAPAVLLFAMTGLMVVLLGRSRLADWEIALPTLAALGFAAAMGVQARGYANHAFPSVALAVFALAMLSVHARGGGQRIRSRLGMAVTVLFGALATALFSSATVYPELAQLVRRVAPAQPRIILAGSNLSVGHPLTRWVDGEWAGRRAALWATGAAVLLLDRTTTTVKRDRLQQYIEEDRRIFVEDVVRARPDVVLVPGIEGRQWIAANPDVARALADYRNAGSAQDVDVLVRSPISRGR